VELITINLLGIEKTVWDIISSHERLMYKMVAMILFIISTMSIVAMSFIGYSVMGKTFISIGIGVFFSFLFFNIYRFALVSIGVVLGKNELEKTSPEKVEKTNGFNLKYKFYNITKVINVSSLVRTVVVTLIGYIISFGWALALDWTDVINFNNDLIISTTAIHSREIYLSKTAIFITNQPLFRFWSCFICGIMLLGLALKKQLLNGTRYNYIKLVKDKYEAQIAENYNELASTANSYFEQNNIEYEFDSVWRNPPYKTELKLVFNPKSSVDLNTLINGK
jgi:hypothetical protein